ncbi:heparinase II/III domain-containing protein [Gaoshiqia sp. Z1-71]|uniref:heparinase II/III domain-containing protein n=1 Tax=Gaoshiqia hydrogeniformans TaxID=3290090 RepID=UPI003BF7E016
MSQLVLIFYTVRHLRPIQIRYQLWYRVRRYWRRLIGFRYPLSIQRDGYPLHLTPWIEKSVSFEQTAFTFLNQSLDYPGTIDWNEPRNGKLWSYNLNYMDYLLQTGMNQEKGLILIEQFITGLPGNASGTEPYPTALRGINWIKFFSQYAIHNTQYSSSLYAQYLILLDNLEYHLLGNHLLEDGFSLLFGAFYFKDEIFYRKAREIIIDELQEQVLEDGAHFELSIMYHQILLDRLLDCINLLKNNVQFADQKQFLGYLLQKAQKMLGWLNALTFANGQAPLLNDAAPNIAPTAEQLNDYAGKLDLIGDHLSNSWMLSESGYRKFVGSNYECILDVGAVGPAYQPGHAHADTFNFILNVHQKPVIVDTGISTYEPSAIRLEERGTAAHNTVTVLDKNSSEVWSSFRMARRAHVKIRKETDHTIVAEHDGYRRLKTIHHREWKFMEDRIIVEDNIVGKITEGKAHIWLSPGVTPVKINDSVITDDVSVQFANADEVRLISAKIPLGYNKFADNYKIEILFKNQLNTTITIQ